MSALEAKELRYKGLRTAAIVITAIYLAIYSIDILVQWKEFLKFDNESIMELTMFLVFIAGFVISFKKEVIGGIIIIIISILLTLYDIYIIDYPMGYVFHVPLALAGVFFIIAGCKNRK